jgi:3,2-trans-enoyl-CoA isomerase
MILTFDHDAVRELRLNRPPVNALTTELLVALREPIEQAPSNGVRALILSGSPGRFSGGLDVPALLKLDHAGIAMLWRELYALLRAIARSPIPIIAAITGHAPAGGTVLGLFCDGRVMAEGDYKIGLNEVQVGIPLPPVILAALQRLVGARVAEQLAVSGALLSSGEALRLGLVDELAPAEHVVERALAWCQRLLAVPSEAFLLTRRDARADLATIFDRDLAGETDYVTTSWWSASTQRSLRALVERLGKKV